MYRHILSHKQRGVSLLIMAFTLVLLMGWMSLYLITAQQESMYMATMERKSVINYWENARYKACLLQNSDMTLCLYLQGEE